MRHLALARPNSDDKHVGKIAPWVTIIHAMVPGRTRLRIRGLHRSPSFAMRVLQYLGHDQNLKIVSLSITTGTILIAHPKKKTAHSLRQEVEEIVIQIYHHQISREKQPKMAHPLHVADEKTHQPHQWYLREPKDIASQLDTDLDQGLTQEEAAKRLAIWGPNIKSAAPAKNPWSCFVDQYTNLPSGLLAASAFWSLMTGAALDACLIAGVLLTNGTIGFFTEYRTHQLIRSLGVDHRGMVPTVRAGQLAMVPSSQLVPGDVVILEPGPIPADLRLFQVNHLAVDESALTGESNPVLKETRILDKPKTPLAERYNLAFSGTVMLSGHGRGIVVATGHLTEIGMIERLVTTLIPPKTPMQRNLEKVGHQLVMASLSACGALIVLGLLRGLKGLDVLKTAISLAIASVPEGLPTVGTTTLALGISHMGKKSVFVRHLAAVENLGAVSVICFDKTGTLTLNQMTVTDVVTVKGHYVIEDGTILRDGSPVGSTKPIHDSKAPGLADLFHIARASALCNDATWTSLDEKPERKNLPHSEKDLSQHHQINTSYVTTSTHDTHTEERCSSQELNSYGSPTEKALLQYASGLGVDIAFLRRAYPRLKTFYRSETSRFMTTWHQSPDGHIYVALKGSPEDVLPMCDSFAENGSIKPLSEMARTTFLAENQRLANQALRVLAVAEKILPYDCKKIEFSVSQTFSQDAPSLRGLTWLGFVGLKDPPRAGVGPVLEAFHSAGIFTNMITGDQESTAQAIGRDLGMNGQGSPPRLPIFSRVSPSDKLHIIRSLQNQGHVVAMTGDGVNDSPALRAADVGIAMGGGAGAAIDAAEVILGESDLHTMLEAVRLGRTIRDNLGKAIHFLIATNLSELIVSFAGVLCGNAHVLTPKHLLWINLLTDVFPALGLAFEPSEPSIMLRPPINRKDQLFDKKEWEMIAMEALFMSFASLTSYGWGWMQHRDEKEASTSAFTTLAFSQLLHAIAARSKHLTIFDPKSSSMTESNPWLTKTIAGGIFAQCLTVLAPSLRSILGNTPMTLYGWLVGGMLGGLPFLATQTIQNISNEKFIFHDDSIRRRRHVV